jgi:hypothetical protein
MIVQNNKICSLKDRNSQLSVFVKSISKKSRIEMNTVRVREIVDLEDVEREIISK